MLWTAKLAESSLAKTLAISFTHLAYVHLYISSLSTQNLINFLLSNYTISTKNMVYKVEFGS